MEEQKQKRKEYYEKKKAEDPEFLQKKREKSKEYYINKKKQKELNEVKKDLTPFMDAQQGLEVCEKILEIAPESKEEVERVVEVLKKTKGKKVKLEDIPTDKVIDTISEEKKVDEKPQEIEQKPSKKGKKSAKAD